MKLFKTPKIMIVTAILFSVFIVMFNVYDIATDKTDKAAYTKSDIEKLDVELININTADVDTLCTLPCVGEKTAQEIVRYREQNGDFESAEELMKVKGIGKSEYIRLLPMITI